MSTIVVKNFPEDLHDRLKERAERNRRSMNKEVVHLLAAGLGSESSQPALPGPLRGRLVGSEVIEAANIVWAAGVGASAAKRCARRLSSSPTGLS